MRKNSGLLVVSEDNLITKIIKSLKSFLKIKQDKEEVSNRTAVVLTEEKIERKVKRNIGYDELSKMEEKALQDISYIDKLDEEELNSLDEYYDMRLNELENILNDKKSRYYKLISTKRA
ncbi:MAG: hypothetical protein J6A15_09035 [Clostridia bacterium]|nr:hypothetical protein [Clostridia bacterium]